MNCPSHDISSYLADFRFRGYPPGHQQRIPPAIGPSPAYGKTTTNLMAGRRQYADGHPPTAHPCGSAGSTVTRQRSRRLRSGGSPAEALSGGITDPGATATGVGT